MHLEQDHADVRVPPPLVFAGYLMGALLLRLASPLPMPWPADFRVVGAVALIIGLWLGFAAFSRMAAARTSPDPHRPVTALVTDGPYRLSRNPIYLGFFLIYLGSTLLASTLWGFLLSPLVVLTVNRAVIHPEERYLERRFAAAYIDYKSRVRKWL